MIFILIVTNLYSSIILNPLYKEELYKTPIPIELSMTCKNETDFLNIKKKLLYINNLYTNGLTYNKEKLDLLHIDISFKFFMCALYYEKSTTTTEEYRLLMLRTM